MQHLFLHFVIPNLLCDRHARTGPLDGESRAPLPNNRFRAESPRYDPVSEVSPWEQQQQQPESAGGHIETGWEDYDENGDQTAVAALETSQLRNRPQVTTAAMDMD